MVSNVGNMRVSPTPGQGPHPLHPGPHMVPVGAPSNVIISHPSSMPSEVRPNAMHGSPGYPGAGPPHMTGPPGTYGYPGKMGHMPPGTQYVQASYQQPPGHQHPTRPPSHMMQQYSQNYPPGGPQGPQGQQYPPRPHNSHIPGQPYPYYGQQGWPQSMGQQMMPGMMSSKGGHNQMPGQPAPIPPGANSVASPRPHYLKQHIQHKMAVYSSTAVPLPQMYPNGPGPGPGVPPSLNSRDGPQNMPPPASTPQSATASGTPGLEHEQHPPAPTPPNSTPHSGMTPGIPHQIPNQMPMNNTAPVGHLIANNLGTPTTSNSVNSIPPQIGPDGNPVVDEASQQSTLSNASGASGDDRSTPKSHMQMPPMMSMTGRVPMPGEMMVGPPGSHASQGPLSSAPSPGTASIASQQDEFEGSQSPSPWPPRSPSANIYMNSQQGPPPAGHQDMFNRQKDFDLKPDINIKRKTSDSMLKLFEMNDFPERRLWLERLLKFMEENKNPITTCPTISKNPLDLFALYHHVRERGGFEEVTRNKHWKDVAAVMGIGASSSGSYTLRRHYMKNVLAFECKFDRGGIDPAPIINQVESTSTRKKAPPKNDPSPGSNSSSMDGFPNGPHMGGPGAPPGMPPGAYPQFPNSEMPGHMGQRPSGPGGPGYPGYQGSQYPGYQGMHSGYPNQSGPYPNSGYPPNSAYQGAPPTQGNYPGYPQSPGFQRTPYGGPPPPQQGFQQPAEQYPMSSNTSAPPQASGPLYGGSQLAKQLLNPPLSRNVASPPTGYQYSPKPGASPSPGPPVPNTAAGPYQGPRRHPDFDKQPAWRPSSTQYGPSPYGPQGPQGPWPRPSTEAGTPPSAPPTQWGQPRYPTPPQGFQNQARWPSSFGANVNSPRSSGPSSSIGSKYLMPQATSFKQVGYGAYMGKQLFPMDSVEAVSPVMSKRRRLNRTDVAQPPIDPWKLFMSLRCGLVSEVTWALDILNILLYDDQTVVFFGLTHMPGLLDTLIEHLRRGLINMFNICQDLEMKRDFEGFEKAQNKSLEDTEECQKKTYLRCTDYSLSTRTAQSVRFLKRDESPTPHLGAGTDNLGWSLEDDSWGLVGGGECTAHILCSIEGHASDIPFTRSMSCKREDEEFQKASDIKKEPNLVESQSFKNGVKLKTTNKPVDSPNILHSNEDQKSKGRIPQLDESETPSPQKCVIKIERMDNSIIKDQKIKNSLSVDKKLVENLKNSKEKPSLETISKTTLPTDKTDSLPTCPTPKDTNCNGPDSLEVAKITQTSSTKTSLSNASATLSKLFPKKNKTASKLEGIVKRIKKEPMGGSGALMNILGSQENKVAESKSILDHILGNSNASANSEDSKNCESVNNSQIDSKILENKSPIKDEDEKPLKEQLMETNKIKEEIKEESMDYIEHTEPSSSPTPPAIELPRTKLKVVSIFNPALEDEELLKNKKPPYEDLESESWCPDESSLINVHENQDWLAKRVIAVGTIIRNLSFVPGNEDFMSKSGALLALLGRTILLHHSHNCRTSSTAQYDKEEDTDYTDWCSSLDAGLEWWWPYLPHIHENTLVTIANISGNLDLSIYPEDIIRPILDGLLHWVTCPASYGQDNLPSSGAGSQSALSPQKLALESIVKLCVIDSNTDLILATPPFSRIELFCSQLTRFLCRGEEQVSREFAINVFNYFSAADNGVSRVIAMQNGCISHLVSFIEDAEAAALSVANHQGVSALKENPELMGTSLDMVRRAANTLVNLSRVSDNCRVIGTCESRFLSLVMSQILDTYVASQLSQVLYNVALVQSDFELPPSPPLSPSVLRQIEERRVAHFEKLEGVPQILDREALKEEKGDLNSSIEKNSSDKSDNAIESNSTENTVHNLQVNDCKNSENTSDENTVHNLQVKDSKNMAVNKDIETDSSVKNIENSADNSTKTLTNLKSIPPSENKPSLPSENKLAKSSNPQVTASNNSSSSHTSVTQTSVQSNSSSTPGSPLSTASHPTSESSSPLQTASSGEASNLSIPSHSNPIVAPPNLQVTPSS